MGTSLAPRLGAFFILLAAISTAAGQVRLTGDDPSVQGAAPQTADIARLSAAEFDATFRCPESYANEGEQKAAVGRMLKWYGAHHESVTIREFIAFRMEKLNAHNCMVTLANIGGSNAAATRKSTDDGRPATRQGQDEPISFDQPTADEAATFDDLVLRTEHCMRNGALAMLRNGSRDREQIAAFQVRSCSGPLVRLMVAPHAPSCRNTVGGPCSSPSRETAVAFATAMAYEQLQRAMPSDR